MKTDIYNKLNKKVGTIDLPDRIFNVKWNPGLVYQALLAQQANRRAPLAHVKTRSEVRGGGRKPWRQKGTGRARHGSIRSPLWAHGGVTFGPRKEKKFEKKINKKMKSLALYSILSRKLRDGEIAVIDDFAFTNHKTKQMYGIMKNFFKGEASKLIVPAPGNRNVYLAARNLPKTKVAGPRFLNVEDCLTHKRIFFEKEAVAQLK